MGKMRHVIVWALLLTMFAASASARDVNIVIGLGGGRRHHAPPPPPPPIGFRPPVVIVGRDRGHHGRYDNRHDRRYGGPPIVRARPGRW